MRKGKSVPRRSTPADKAKRNARLQMLMSKLFSAMDQPTCGESLRLRLHPNLIRNDFTKRNFDG